MDTTKKIFFRSWRTTLLIASLTVVIYLLYFGRLSTLLPGYSSAELATYTQASNWHHIAANPINAPYTLVVWLFTAVLHHNAIVTRLVAASFGVGLTLLFFAIIRQWYSFRVAFLGTLLFATSSGFLHFARLGTGQVLQMSTLALIACMVWYHREQHSHRFIGYWLAAILALLWYVPGMVWFEIVGTLILFKYARNRWRHTQVKHTIGWAALFLLLITPLIIAVIRHPHLLFVIGGLPQNLSAALHTVHNVHAALFAVTTHDYTSSLLWLVKAPLFTVTELVLGALGLYSYWHTGISTRALFLTSMAVLSLVLISLGGEVTFACFIPIVYLFVIHGLRELTSQWLTVFPRNPIAKFVGIAVICIMLFFSVVYQIRTYFVAWPHSVATLQTFDLKRP